MQVVAGATPCLLAVEVQELLEMRATVELEFQAALLAQR
jgi:hypothetical protein